MLTPALPLTLTSMCGRGETHSAKILPHSRNAGRTPSGWGCSSAASPASTAAPRTACTAGGRPPAPQPSASRPAL